MKYANETNTDKTVFVGLSGGVDSSVAALRLQQQGYTVVGVFIKVWHPDWLVCNWEQERLDAMRVAAHLNIPFLTCDAETAYRDNVAQYFIREYEAGRTPNPDVLCNQSVKFGAFLEFATHRGADYIATGHYVQRISGADGAPLLHRGVDSNKDQSYFLWSISNEQLERSLFPVGDTPKTTIRAEAAAAGIPTAHKHDSQGICFLGQIDIPEFLAHYVDLTPGAVLNEAGEQIGTHQGALVYTLGQRHGFTIDNRQPEQSACYVVAKDSTKNTITVAAQPPTLTPRDRLTLTNVVLRDTLTPSDQCVAQFRYRQTPVPVTIESMPDSTHLIVQTHTDTEQPAAGQSCVLYRGTHCLGGGIIG